MDALCCSAYLDFAGTARTARWLATPEKVVPEVSNSLCWLQAFKASFEPLAYFQGI